MRRSLLVPAALCLALAPAHAASIRIENLSGGTWILRPGPGEERPETTLAPGAVHVERLQPGESVLYLLVDGAGLSHQDLLLSCAPEEAPRPGTPLAHTVTTEPGAEEGAEGVVEVAEASVSDELLVRLRGNAWPSLAASSQDSPHLSPGTAALLGTFLSPTQAPSLPAAPRALTDAGSQSGSPDPGQNAFSLPPVDLVLHLPPPVQPAPVFALPGQNLLEVPDPQDPPPSGGPGRARRIPGGS
ncbi:MAG TPA: hypothetical protein VK188_10460 [Holophaga sp.]|nr:hypothetical protein [Holophaga sp.]